VKEPLEMSATKIARPQSYQPPPEIPLSSLSITFAKGRPGTRTFTGAEVAAALNYIRHLDITDAAGRRIRSPLTTGTCPATRKGARDGRRG
jgi:hypothetical protein